MKFIILFVFGMSWSLCSFSSVKITINEAVYTYEGNPRLLEVLTPIALQKPWYWQSAALYRIDKDYIERLKAEVLHELIEVSGPEIDNQAFKTLENQIREWRLADRVLIPIDYDLARVNPKFNPQFENGEYLLILKERPATVPIIGMVNKSINVEHQAGIPVKEYLSSVQRNEKSDNSFVYIVQSNGDIKKSGVAYWNNSDEQIMAGVQVYIPISESQFSNKTKTLNMQIARLAANRILK